MLAYTVLKSEITYELFSDNHPDRIASSVYRRMTRVVYVILAVATAWCITAAADAKVSKSNHNLYE